MVWSVTLTVVDCSSISTPLCGATVWLGSELVGRTDTNGQILIIAEDQWGWVNLTMSKAGSPDYIDKNLIIHSPLNGSAQTVCLSQTSISCFTGETSITLSEGGQKPIAALQIGDRVLGRSTRPNYVIAIHPSHLGHRKLYAVNGGAPFVTAEHPFLTAEGWKAISPDASVEKSLNDRVGSLHVTDILLRLDNRPLAASPWGSGASVNQCSCTLQW